MKTIVGLYDDIATARTVVEELAAAGFERGDISLVANNSTTGMTGTGTTGDDGEAMAEGAAGGALVGGALGGLGGLLLGLGALAIPGIGPVVAAGPIVAGLTGAGIGAAVGGLAGALINWGVPQEEAEFYAEGVRRGGTLVAVKSDEDHVNEALRIMNQYGPVDVRERSATWRSEGWTGFNADADLTSDAYATNATRRTASTDTSSTARNVENEKAIPIVEEELRVGKREVEKGGVRVHSYMEERPVQESVEVREENVYVERRPVDRAVDPSTVDAFQERTYEVRERAEEVVAEKQARVVEEVVVGKTVDTHVETVEDTLRRTKVDVENVDTANYDTHFRTHFDQTYGSRGYDYTRYQPAYTYGSGLANEARFHGRDWTSIEADVRRDWESRNSGAWEEFKDAVRYGWENLKSDVRRAV